MGLNSTMVLWGAYESAFTKLFIKTSTPDWDDKGCNDEIEKNTQKKISWGLLVIFDTWIAVVVFVSYLHALSIAIYGFKIYRDLW